MVSGVEARRRRSRALGLSAGIAFVCGSLGVQAQEEPGRPLAAIRIATVGDSEAIALGGRTIEGVAILGSGDIVLPAFGSSALAVLRVGQDAFQIGRSGAGPGEFRSVVTVGSADGVRFWAFDVAAGRFTLFEPSLEVARTMGLARQGVTLTGVLAPDRESALVLYERPFGELGRGAEFVVENHTGAEGVVLRRFPIEDARFAMPVGDQDLMGIQPWGLLPRWSHSAVSGTLSLAVEASSGHRDRGRLVIYGFGPGRASVDSLIVDLPTRQLSNAEVMAGAETIAASVAEMVELDPARVADALHQPTTAPLLHDFRAGEDGWFYLGLGSDPEGRTWRALDGAGRHRLDFLLPPRSRLLFADWPELLVTTLDDFDVPHLYSYRVVS